MCSCMHQYVLGQPKLGWRSPACKIVAACRSSRQVAGCSLEVAASAALSCSSDTWIESICNSLQLGPTPCLLYLAIYILLKPLLEGIGGFQSEVPVHGDSLNHLGWSSRLQGCLRDGHWDCKSKCVAW